MCIKFHQNHNFREFTRFPCKFHWYSIYKRTVNNGNENFCRTKKRSSIHPVMKRVSTLWAMEIEHFHRHANRINEFIYSRVSVEKCPKFIVFFISNAVRFYSIENIKEGFSKPSMIYNRSSWMIWIMKPFSFIQFQWIFFYQIFTHNLKSI